MNISEKSATLIVAGVVSAQFEHLLKLYELMILATPTGPARNRLTELRIGLWNEQAAWAKYRETYMVWKS